MIMRRLRKCYFIVLELIFRFSYTLWRLYIYKFKRVKKFKIGISAIEGMETLKDSLCISEEFFDFYFISRKLRNRLAHRYKLPKDEELLLNLKENLKNIDELERVIENLLKIN